MNSNETAKTILGELQNIISDINNDELDELVNILLSALKNHRKVYCAGAGRSLLMIRTFAMRLMHMGIESYVVGETSTPAIQCDDIVIFGSGSGETGALTIMMKKAKSVGAKVALITRSKDSTLARQADYLIYIPIEKGLSNFQPNGSTFEQSMLIICDAMVLSMMKKGKLIPNGLSIDDYIKQLHANLE